MLSLHLFGVFEATFDGQPLTAFATDKVRALLAYLALTADQAHDRSALAALLWTELPDAVALANLRKSLSRLRQTLEAASPLAGEAVLEVTRHAVRLNGRAVMSDVAEFRSLLSAAELHPHGQLHTCRDCLSRLEAAVALYRADLLTGFAFPDASGFDEWLVVERESLHRQLMATLQSLAAAYLRRGEGDKAIEHAGRQLATEPWHEDAHRQMMQALALAGRRSEALAQYEKGRAALAEHLGLAPAAETTAIYERLRDESAEVVPRPDGVTLSHFPTQYTAFVGRDQELLTVRELLVDPSCRLLTLVGPGGVGKTRLAIEAAERLAGWPAASSLPGGIVFVSLASLESAALVPAALAAALGLTLAPNADPVEQLLSYLADKSLLVILDNFEHVAAAVGLVTKILDTAPRVRLLVTSRVPFHLRAERQVILNGLPYSTVDPTTAPADYDAVRLFIQQAGHFRPGHTLSEADLQSADEICRQVDGLPLAIEIAASWLSIYDCRTIAAEIGRSRRFLVNRLADVADRQRSMAAVFDYSWRLLTPAEQAVLAESSVFQGPFDLRAAEEVTRARPEVLARLVDHGLVQRASSGRFALHALAREFAADRLGALEAPVAEAHSAQQRHSAYFLRWLADLEPVFLGMNPQEGMAATRPVLDDVRRAWAFAVANGEVEALTAAVESLGRFYLLAGLAHEGTEVFARAGQALGGAPVYADPGEGPRALAVCQMIIWQAFFASSVGRFEEATTAASQALSLAEALGTPRLRSQARTRLSQCLLLEGDYERSRQLQLEAVELARQSGDQYTLAEALSRLGVLHFRTGRAAEAVPILEEFLRLAEWLADRMQIGGAHGDLAVSHMILGNLDRALTHNKEALRVAQDLGHRGQEAVHLGNLGFLRFQLGQDEGALACMRRALAINEEMGNHFRIAQQLANLGHFFRRQGQPAIALDHYERAMAYIVRPGLASFLYSLLIDKAEALFDLGELGQAHDANREGLAHMIELGHAEHVIQGQILAARIDDALGDRPGARRALEALLDGDGEPEMQAAVHFELWRLGGGPSHGAAAAALYRQALRHEPLYDFRVRLEQLEAAGVATLGAERTTVTP